MGERMGRNGLDQLRLGEGWVHIRVHGEPYVIATFRGYAPVLEVEDIHARTRHYIFMSAKSFMEGIEPLRAANGGGFGGLEFRIRKDSDDRFAKYVIEQ